MRLPASLLSLLLPLSTACFPGIAGSREAATERRDVEAFSAVVVEGTIDVHVEVVAGARTKVEVHCDDNLLHHIDTEVHGDTLHVVEDRDIDPRVPCFVAVTTDELVAVFLEGPGDLQASGDLDGLEQVHVSGPGDVEIDGIDVDVLEVDLEGPGDVVLGGHASELHVRSEAPGDVDASDLHADDVFVVAEGPGDVVVRASESCTVELDGPGDVVVLGAPDERHLHDEGPGDIDLR